MILTPRDLQVLEPLRPAPRRSFPGQVRGERLTRRKGVSIEFADYRDYSTGDDLRHLDWNVLARLETAVIKTYQDEEDLAVYTLLDCSRSMAFGEPTKFEAAVSIAAAIGFCALNSQDAVHALTLGLRNRKPHSFRARTSYGKFDLWLQSQVSEGTVSASESLKEFATLAGRTGIAAIISDGLDPDLGRSIKALSARGFEIWFVQILSALELDPDLEGDLKLIDSESGDSVDITANGAALAAYRRNLQAHCEGIAEACRKGGGRYALHTAGEPLVNLIQGPMRRDGWLAA